MSCNVDDIDKDVRSSVDAHSGDWRAAGKIDFHHAMATLSHSKFARWWNQRVHEATEQSAPDIIGIRDGKAKGRPIVFDNWRRNATERTRCSERSRSNESNEISSNLVSFALSCLLVAERFSGLFASPDKQKRQKKDAPHVSTSFRWSPFRTNTCLRAFVNGERDPSRKETGI